MRRGQLRMPRMLLWKSNIREDVSKMFRLKAEYEELIKRLKEDFKAEKKQLEVEG